MTLERRITTVLATLAPLTGRQIALALAPTSRDVVNTLLCDLNRQGRVRRVSCSAKDRHRMGGKLGGAYVLGGRA